MYYLLRRYLVQGNEALIYMGETAGGATHVVARDFGFATRCCTRMNNDHRECVYRVLDSPEFPFSYEPCDKNWIEKYNQDIQALVKHD